MSGRVFVNEVRTSAGAFTTLGKNIYEWEVTETAGATAEIELRDGSASGPLLKRVKGIAANTSLGDRCNWHLSVGTLTLVITSGAVSVTCHGAGV